MGNSIIGQKVMDNEEKNGNKRMTYKKQSSKRQKKWAIEAQRCKWRSRRGKVDEIIYYGFNEHTKKNQRISANDSVKAYKSHTCGQTLSIGT